MYADPPDLTKTLATAYLRYAVFQDPKWDYMTFDFDSAMALADRIDDGVTKATDPNPQAFFGVVESYCSTTAGVIPQ